MTESGKMMIAAALSVLMHVSLFTALALMPAAPVVPVNRPDSEKPLEVTLQAAPEPMPEPEAPVVAVEPPPLNPVETEAVRMQLDPENLKKAEKAPEKAALIAAHDSQATPEKPEAAATPPPPPLPPPAPTPTPSPTLVLQHAPTATPTPTPATNGPADEVGIDAIGNYSKAVANAIGARWSAYQQAQRDALPVGEVRIKFAIDAQGTVSALQVLSNTGTSVNAAFAVRALKEAKIPPIPLERLAQVPSGRIEITYTFTNYPTP